MRIAVFADIHGNLPAFSAMLDDMENSEDFDQIWCLGDVAALGGQPHDVIQKLVDLREHYGKDKFKIIGGNTDRYLVTGERFPMRPPQDEADFEAYRQTLLNNGRALDWNLQQLTWDDINFLKDLLGHELRQTITGYGTVIGFHAIPGNNESMALRPDTDDEEAADALLDRAGKLAVCGHTHLAMERHVRGWTIINPGSVGLSFGHPGYAEWACLSWADGELTADLRRVAYDVTDTLAQWDAVGFPTMDVAHNRLTTKA